MSDSLYTSLCVPSTTEHQNTCRTDWNMVLQSRDQTRRLWISDIVKPCRQLQQTVVTFLNWEKSCFVGTNYQVPQVFMPRSLEHTLRARVCWIRCQIYLVHLCSDPHHTVQTSRQAAWASRTRKYTNHTHSQAGTVWSSVPWQAQSFKERLATTKHVSRRNNIDHGFRWVSTDATSQPHSPLPQTSACPPIFQASRWQLTQQ